MASFDMNQPNRNGSPGKPEDDIVLNTSQKPVVPNANPNDKGAAKTGRGPGIPMDAIDPDLAGLGTWDDLILATGPGAPQPQPQPQPQQQQQQQQQQQPQVLLQQQQQQQQQAQQPSPPPTFTPISIRSSPEEILKHLLTPGRKVGGDFEDWFKVDPNTGKRKVPDIKEPERGLFSIGQHTTSVLAGVATAVAIAGFCAVIAVEGPLAAGVVGLALLTGGVGGVTYLRQRTLENEIWAPIAKAADTSGTGQLEKLSEVIVALARVEGGFGEIFQERFSQAWNPVQVSDITPTVEVLTIDEIDALGNPTGNQRSFRKKKDVDMPIWGNAPKVSPQDRKSLYAEIALTKERKDLVAIADTVSNLILTAMTESDSAKRTLNVQELGRYIWLVPGILRQNHTVLGAGATFLPKIFRLWDPNDIYR